MSLDDQQRFTDALDELLTALDDRPSLASLLSTNALDEHRNGSHARAHQLMHRAVATAHPSPACLDRLTIDLVKLGEKIDAATILRDALTRPIPSDSMRKRLARCSAGLTPPTDTDSPGDEVPDVPEPVIGARHLRPGENTVVDEGLGVPGSAGTTREPSSSWPRARCFSGQMTDGSIRHGGEQTLGNTDLFEELRVDLPAVPAHLATIAVCASVHDRTFAGVDGPHVRCEGGTNLVFTVPTLTTERAVVLFEFYRRAGTWKVRAVGQGYDDGLADLARDIGVEVT